MGFLQDAYVGERDRVYQSKILNRPSMKIMIDVDIRPSTLVSDPQTAMTQSHTPINALNSPQNDILLSQKQSKVKVNQFFKNSLIARAMKTSKKAKNG